VGVKNCQTSPLSRGDQGGIPSAPLDKGRAISFSRKKEKYG